MKAYIQNLVGKTERPLWETQIGFLRKDKRVFRTEEIKCVMMFVHTAASGLFTFFGTIKLP